KYDIDIIMTGKPKSAREKMRTILSVIGEGVTEDELYKSLSEFGVGQEEGERYVHQLEREGIIYSPRRGFYKKV
ncbi:TPA: Minichromosome maintenance protein MCM, partial [Candidatus Bathyarchaeota archaeon]|nr:Minichromosome maintenance protein MCM [Candidatus Bathyarchaeota archaeon]